MFGADIDTFNIKWLNHSVGSDVGLRVDFSPPTPYSSEHFDIIYGHSVLTHLSFRDQFEWLGELHRILKPGGFAFLTVCTEPGVQLTRFSDIGSFYDKFISDGFFDVGPQNVGVDAGNAGYYRLVFHTERFISETWSHYFTIRRILPCYFDHQTLCVLEKR